MKNNTAHKAYCIGTIIIVLLPFLLSACSFSSSNTNEPEYNESFLVVDDNYFDSLNDDKDSFEVGKIYFHGKITSVINDDVHFEDESGHEFTMGLGQDDTHDFENYVGRNCECYCIAIRTFASGFFSTGIDISFFFSDIDCEDCKIVFDDGTVFSEYDNCTMHDYSWLNDTIAYSYSKDGIEEYHLINIEEGSIRFAINNQGHWYYADGIIKGHIFHRPDVVFFDGFSEELWLQGDSILNFSINEEPGKYATRCDLTQTQNLLNEVVNSGQATVLNRDTYSQAFDVKDELLETTDIPTKTQPEQIRATYILNTNTLVFHLPGCSSVNEMNNSNKQEFTGTRDEAIAMGYSPCGRCNP